MDQEENIVGENHKLKVLTAAKDGTASTLTDTHSPQPIHFLMPHFPRPATTAETLMVKMADHGVTPHPAQ